MEEEFKEIIEIERDHDLDSINNPIVNVVRISRDDIKKRSEKSPGKFEYKPRNNQYKAMDNQYKPRENNQHTRKCYQQSRNKWHKDVCRSCGLTDKEVFKFCKENHKHVDNCYLRGPDYINNKEIREKVNQYYLKNQGGFNSTNRGNLTKTNC